MRSTRKSSQIFVCFSLKLDSQWGGGGDRLETHGHNGRHASTQMAVSVQVGDKHSRSHDGWVGKGGNFTLSLILHPDGVTACWRFDGGSTSQGRWTGAGGGALHERAPITRSASSRGSLQSRDPSLPPETAQMERAESVHQPEQAALRLLHLPLKAAGD